MLTALPPPARLPLVSAAAATAGLLLVTSGRYGYHRDELYFRAAGEHLAWGYPDQPPMIPFLARLMTEIAPGSLPVFRLPSAIAVAGLVVVTGLIAREFGGGRSAQALAAAATGVAALTLGAGHLLSTTTMSLLAWAVLLWLIVRIVRTDNRRLWVLVGLVAGVGLLANSLVAFLMAGVVAALLIAGPRHHFRSPWLYAGGAIALVLWAPYVIWQARHGFPQLDVAADIASGGSGTSEPRSLFFPIQLGLVSPFLAPVWIAGLVLLFRRETLRPWRFLGWAYVVLAIVFVATCGKPYYLGGMYPLLLGAGAQPAVDWLRRHRPNVRRLLVAGAFVLTATAWPVFLPLLPLDVVDDAHIVDANYDAGEQIGWPTYVAQVQRADLDVIQPANPSALIAHNYGIAGAIERYGPQRGLELPVFSGHNGYWYWGPPPAATQTIRAVGYSEAFLRRSFRSVTRTGTLDNGRGIDNDEQGEPVFECGGPLADWDTIWDRFKDIGGQL